MSDFLFPNPEYRARCTRIIDGDTIDVEIDLGLRCYRRERLRLLLINAPEMKGETFAAGIAAKAFLASLVVPGNPSWNLLLRGIKKDTDSFGRWLALIFIQRDENNQPVCANDLMREAGHAVEYRK